MHMEPVQRYVISMSREEAVELYKEMGELPSGKVKGALLDLYQTLEIWT